MIRGNHLLNPKNLYCQNLIHSFYKLTLEYLQSVRYFDVGDEVV